MPEPRPAETLEISPDKLAFLILKARAFDVQTAASDTNDSSNPSDDRSVSVLEEQSDDPTERELSAAIWALSEDEQVALVALAWIGRGDFEANEWEEAKALARERRGRSTARYLMGMPQLGDYLDEGAATLGISLSEI